MAATLESLGGQQAPARWEVLLVDNGSDESAATSVARLRSRFPVELRLERESRHGIAFARNRALATGRGELLLFVDDDATCRPGWLAAHVRAFRDRSMVAAGGRILPVLPDEAPAWFRAEALSRIGGPTSRYDLGDDPLEVGARVRRPEPYGANMGVRRDALRTVGGFRTDLGWGPARLPGEDTELMRRLAALGGRLGYVPDAIVDHHVLRERCTHDYFVAWYRALGRASIRHDPPSTRLAALGRAAAASRRAVPWWLFGQPTGERPASPRWRRMVRKGAAAQGRLEELLAGRGDGVGSGQSPVGFS